MGMDYWWEALASIKLVQAMVSPGRVQLHWCQCQYLSSKMSDTRYFLTDKWNFLAGITSGDDVQRKALRQLHFTVKRAETLVRGCCCEVESLWLESAVTLPQIKEDIVDILLDLRWWTSMVDIAIASVTSGGKTEQELLEEAEMGIQSLVQEFKSPNNKLDEAFVRDREQLLRRVQEVLSSYSGKPQDLDFLLAKHVRTRLGNTDLVQSMADVELNAHEVVHLIGSGSFGAVMNVKWLGRSCALKCLNSKCVKEATSLSTFHHPHIVQFFRYWEAARVSSDALSSEPDENLKSHILMECLATDLEQHLLRSNPRVESKRSLSTSRVAPMSQEAAIDAMLQVTKAMSHLNDSDVAHRDLKPSNVLLMLVSKEEFPELAERGYVRLKLGDFGLVKMKAMSSVSTKLTTKMGTRRYAAPEVFPNEEIEISERGKAFPRKADVWSFGIMLSEVLSGQQQDKNGGAQLQVAMPKRAGVRPSLPATCPAYLKFIITNCCEFRPQDRPRFTDLWRLLRIAQVRSLGLIREDYDFFTFTTREGIERRLHELPAPVKDAPVEDASVEDEVFSCFCMRIPYAKYKRELSQRKFSWKRSTAGPSMPREDMPLDWETLRTPPQAFRGGCQWAFPAHFWPRSRKIEITFPASPL